MTELLTEHHPLDELLQNNGHQLVRSRQLRFVVERVRDALVAVDARADRLVARLKEEGVALDARLDTIEDVQAIRLTVVANPAALPASAGVLQWYRVTGDPAVYVGNGAGQPLRKLTTGAL